MAKQAPKKDETVEEQAKHDPFVPAEGGNIDDRMAALLKDHQDMGARPSEDKPAK